VTDDVIARLRGLLVDEYGSLRRRLARRLGSTDFASEVLHEAWLRLGRMDVSGVGIAIHNPPAYLYRMALNLAADRRYADQQWLEKAEIEGIFRRAQDELDPGRIIEARSEIWSLSCALEALPPLRRAIFIASRVEDLPHKLIAERHGVTIRQVDRELKAALEHFARILNKKVIPRRGPRPLETS
jgi:RNA polymerase sigma factor (sigma-70 family)